MPTQPAECALGDVVLRHGPRTFVLQVEGSSMEPDYRDRDLIFVDPDMTPRHQHDVVVMVHGARLPLLKRLEVVGGDNYVISTNTAYRDIARRLEPTDKIVGVVFFAGVFRG